MTEQERIVFRQKLRSIRWIIFISIWGLFGLIMWIKDCNETRQRRADMKEFKGKLAKMVNNPSLYDFYEFQTKGLEAKFGKFPGHGKPIGKVCKLEGDLVWIRLYNKPSYPSKYQNDEEKIAFYENKKSDLDTILLKKSELLATLHRDTLMIRQQDTAYLILELLDIERLDGPKIQASGGNFREEKEFTYHFYNNSLDGVVMAIEPKIGYAVSDKPLPIELSMGQNSRITVSGTKDNGVAEFDIIAASQYVSRMVFKVKIEKNKTTVERQLIN
jgi:hypothetical protein